ncbi:MAG: 23S rRNA pseudouridine(1911/1915/1917) synthase RluD [Zoogloeaceae bacterium]|jgi:23S rRNA pseudouridine1911/1915/1917 synthase|nr:23S rRNA pseudouridine(1911/1915/1917) synthase RluD [Zoogloeaceae bacterium]
MMMTARSNENGGDYTLSLDEDWCGKSVERLRVPETEAGERLDAVLARLLPQHSRSRLQGWIREGVLWVDGSVETSLKRRLKGGEALELAAEPETRLPILTPEAIPLDVVYEDRALLVIEKPAGLVVHPGNGNWQGTLMNGLLHHDPALARVPRAGIVHRLDKDTSGLLVVARTPEAQTDLVRQLQARGVRREYLAVAQGEISRDGRVEAPIGRHPKDRIKMAVVQGGKPAVTHYQVLRRFAGATLLRCRLETGRTHQIRVHLAHLGYPLLGDPVYGRNPRRTLPAFARQALHAARLGLIHPESGAAMAWEAPLPEDMRALLATLEQQNAGDA